jgi:hypothetical protein
MYNIVYIMYATRCILILPLSRALGIYDSVRLILSILTPSLQLGIVKLARRDRGLGQESGLTKPKAEGAPLVFFTVEDNGAALRRYDLLGHK